MALTSVSLFVGTADCNAKCSHCSGIPFRKYAPKLDGVIDRDLIYKTLTDCHAKGARSLSILGCGEPTLSPLSVTKTLELVCRAKQEGSEYSPVNLYSNGIRIGQEPDFASLYLSRWKELGLTTAYLTVYDLLPAANARVYQVDSYPEIDVVFRRVHAAGLSVRANIVLSHDTVATYDQFVKIVEGLKALGADGVSAWPIKDVENKVDLLKAPPETELDKMAKWVSSQSPQDKIRLILSDKSRGPLPSTKLTLFSDGTLASDWCKY